MGWLFFIANLAIKWDSFQQWSMCASFILFVFFFNCCFGVVGKKHPIFWLLTLLIIFLSCRLLLPLSFRLDLLCKLLIFQKVILGVEYWSGARGEYEIIGDILGLDFQLNLGFGLLFVFCLIFFHWIKIKTNLIIIIGPSIDRNLPINFSLYFDFYIAWKGWIYYFINAA
jgi:hypothetical protein